MRTSGRDGDMVGMVSRWGCKFKQAGQERFSLKMSSLSKDLKTGRESAMQVPCPLARFSAAWRVTPTDQLWTVFYPQEATGSCGSREPTLQRAESQSWGAGLGGGGGGCSLFKLLVPGSLSVCPGGSSRFPHFLLPYPSVFSYFFQWLALFD